MAYGCLWFGDVIARQQVHYETTNYENLCILLPFCNALMNCFFFILQKEKGVKKYFYDTSTTLSSKVLPKIWG
jgi:hypothetical protein